MVDGEWNMVNGNRKTKIRSSAVLALTLLLALTAALAACGQSATEGVTTAAMPIESPSRTLTLLPTIDLSYQTWETEWIATEDALGTVVARYPGNCGPYRFLISPDGNWLAQDCFADKFLVVNLDGSKMWELTYFQVFGDAPNYPNNSGGITPLVWTDDSRYLYFIVYTCCWDPFEEEGQYDSQPVYRLDLESFIWEKADYPLSLLP
jgi:hypothetical protein